MKNMFKIGVTVCLVTILFSLTIMLAIGTSTLDEYSLPPPLSVDMTLEKSIFRRMSIREFTDEPISDEELSTILWAAYGLRDDGKRTVTEIDGVHAAVIYVFNKNAVYTYNALNHSLVVYREGDHRGDIDILQYDAPIQLGLCWDTSKADPNRGGAELGEIGQNIQFMANALSLGTVVTGQIPPAIDPLGLPPNEEGLIIMPLGHPVRPYNFVDKPMWISLLPRIRESPMSLTTVLEKRNETMSLEGELTRQELSQLLWSSYGFSNYIDNSKQEPINLKRHRTVPSAHGYYPLVIYAVTKDGVYSYYPNFLTNILTKFGGASGHVDFFGLPIVTFMMKIKNVDMRKEIAQALSEPGIASAPLFIVPILDLEMAKELSGEYCWRFWYYEAGASAHNVLLEATAWDLSANIIFPTDIDSIRSILGLNDDLVPTLVVPVGR